MNKLKILSILPALVLCSCGAKKNKFAGTYQFRLGKSDGNHMEMTATITDDNDPKVEGYKILNLSGDLGDQLDVMGQIEELEDMLDELVKKGGSGTDTELDKITDLVTALKAELKDLKTIPFFYKVSTYKNAKYGQRLELGTHFIRDLVDSIKAKKPELAEFIDDMFEMVTGVVQILDKSLYIMPEMSKYAFNAFVNKKALTFQVPISPDDLNQQFIWYGLDPEKNFLADFELDKNYMEKMPGVKGEDRFGTHPARVMKNNVVVKDEVAEMNKTFAYQLSKSPFYKTAEGDDFETFGKFYLDKTGDTKKLYLKYEGDEFAAGTYSGFFGSSREAIKLKIEKDGLCDVKLNGQTGYKERFIDENGEEFRFSDVVEDPYEIRDFNVVDVGLNKVEL